MAFFERLSEDYKGGFFERYKQVISFMWVELDIKPNCMYKSSPIL